MLHLCFRSLCLFRSYLILTQKKAQIKTGIFFLPFSVARVHFHCVVESYICFNTNRTIKILKTSPPSNQEKYGLLLFVREVFEAKVQKFSACPIV